VQPLAEKLADAFMMTNSGVKVVIQGGGSSVGIKAARDGTVNIGASSRDLTETEQSGLINHILAKDGIAIVVHPSNNVSDLTSSQVRTFYRWDNELEPVGRGR
jgi:phosphate transport system substrate-binding protein